MVSLLGLSSSSVSALCQQVFSAVVHSLMDEMKFPVLRGWAPNQVKLSLAASNALVSGLNEVLGECESLRSFFSMGPVPLCNEFNVSLMRKISCKNMTTQCVLFAHIHTVEGLTVPNSLLAMV